MQNNWNNKAKILKEQLISQEEKAICNNKSLIKSKDYMMIREEKLYQMRKHLNKLAVKIRILLIS